MQVEEAEERCDKVIGAETRGKLEVDRKSASDELVVVEEEGETRTSYSGSILKQSKNDVGEEVGEGNSEPAENVSSKLERGIARKGQDKRERKPNRAPTDNKRIEELRSSEDGSCKGFVEKQRRRRGTIVRIAVQVGDQNRRRNSVKMLAAECDERNLAPRDDKAKGKEALAS